ncbi:MAG: hypothetical protein D6747_08105 [Chlorobiota bacterium]|nr:MAG: hypothetical protein D6747_08105 [Chlorobiota bacterium]
MPPQPTRIQIDTQKIDQYKQAYNRSPKSLTTSGKGPWSFTLWGVNLAVAFLHYCKEKRPDIICFESYKYIKVGRESTDRNIVTFEWSAQLTASQTSFPRFPRASSSDITERKSLLAIRLLNAMYQYIQVTLESSFTAEADELLKTLEKDPLLHQQIVDNFNQRFHQKLDNLSPQLQNCIEKHASIKSDQSERWLQNFDKEVEGILKNFTLTIETELQQLINATFDRLSKVKKEYSKYKRIMTGKVVIQSLGVAGGVVSTTLGLASAPTGVGVAGVVVGLISTIKSLTSLINTICDLALDADEIEERVLTVISMYYDNLQFSTAQKPQNVHVSNPGQVAKTTVSSFLGDIGKFAYNATYGIRKGGRHVANKFRKNPKYHIPHSTQGDKFYHWLFTNIKSVQEDCELWGHKLDGLEVKAHDLARKIPDLLLKVTKLPSNNNSPSMKKLSDKFTQLFESVTELIKQVNEKKPLQQKAMDWITTLNDKLSVHVRRYEKAMPITVNMAQSAASVGLGSASGGLEAAAGEIKDLGQYIYGWIDTGLFGLGLPIGETIHDQKSGDIY